MKWGFIWLALFAAAGAEAGCGDAAKTMEYRSTPPLLAHDNSSALVVSVHADGCVNARLPAFDMRRGEYQLRFPEKTYRRFEQEIHAADLASIDMRAVRRDVERAKAARLRIKGAVLYRVSDENIITIEMMPGGASRTSVLLHTTSLRHDLLNMPESVELQRVAAVQSMFEELASEVQQKGARQ
jgi:hypothetical protein